MTLRRGPERQLALEPLESSRPVRTMMLGDELKEEPKLCDLTQLLDLTQLSASLSFVVVKIRIGADMLDPMSGCVASAPEDEDRDDDRDDDRLSLGVDVAATAAAGTALLLSFLPALSSVLEPAACSLNSEEVDGYII